MNISIPLITAGINLVSKIVSAVSGGGKGGQQAPAAGAEGGSFKDAMQLVDLAKSIGKMLNPGEAQKLEKLMASGDFKEALGMLQQLLAQLQQTQPQAQTQVQPQAQPQAAQATSTVATNPGGQEPQARFLRLDAESRTGLKGFTTNGDPGDRVGLQAPGSSAAAPPADPLAGLVGAGKTKPAPAGLFPTVPTPTVSTPTAVTPTAVTPDLSRAIAQAIAEAGRAAAPTAPAAPPTESSPDALAINMTAGAGGTSSTPDLVSIQVQGGNANAAGQQGQETFFLVNALKKELKAKDVVTELEGNDQLGAAPPGVTYEVPRITSAQIDLAMAPRVDTQKLIDQIMDGAFKAPYQLPKTVNLDLNPAHLGRLQVQVSLHDDGVRIQMLTPHAHVKAALEQGVDQLRTAMNDAGLQLGHMGVDVRQDGAGQQRFAGHQPGQQRGNRFAFGRHSGDDGLTVEAATGPPDRATLAAMLSAVNAFA